MAIFDVPNWLELPISLGFVLLTYATTFLLFGFGCFILVLAYFLLSDRPSATS